MAIYSDCKICENWDDLTDWRGIAFVCANCYDKLTARDPIVEGKRKNSKRTFDALRKEVQSHGKASTQAITD